MADVENAAPATSGLGNYKGVMLCNRPDAMKSEKAGPAPFKSTVAESYGQQLGLNPCKELPIHEDRGPDTCPAIRKHAAWLKTLQDEMKKHKANAAAARDAEAKKAENVKKMSERQREGVKKALEAQRDSLRHDVGEAVKALNLNNVPVDKKPKWALSEEEKEEFDLLEADKLLNFADELDFDSFVHDLEFRQALETLTGRAKDIEREQAAFKNELVAALNEASEAGDDIGDSASRAGAKEDYLKAKEARMKENGWDSSTVCGEKREDDFETRSNVDRVLASHSDIRSVHSKESVKRIIEKQKDKAEKAVRTLQTVAENSSVPQPTVATHDPNKKNKEVDPSMLPYLYRSPAI